LETESSKDQAPTTAKSVLNWDQWLYKWFLVKPSLWLFVVGGVLMVSQVLTVVADSGSRFLPWPNPFLGGALEIEELQMGLLSAMMLGYTWFLGGHIRIELFREKMKPRAGAVSDTLAGICGVVYSAGASWGVLKAAFNSWAIDARTDILQLPIAPFQFFFAGAFIHFTLILLAYTIRSIYRIIYPPAPESVEKKEVTDI
jgi:TRAP-type C4-dicarboxylate transport system permease small subunit